MIQTLIDNSAVAAMDDTAAWAAKHADECAPAYRPQTTPADAVAVDLSSARQHAKRAAPEVIEASIKATERAIADSRKTPAERRIDHLQREADRYAESVTRGIEHTEAQRQRVAQRRMVELLSAALVDATQHLGDALDLMESEARETWMVEDKKALQERFEAVWCSEQPALYLGWKELQRQALRSY